MKQLWGDYTAGPHGWQFIDWVDDHLEAEYRAAFGRGWLFEVR